MLTLEDIHRLALLYCPPKARRKTFLVSTNDWAPAHEIGHALIEPKCRWSEPDYGRCAIAFCECGQRNSTCDVYELAAMTVSRRLMLRVERPDLVKHEINATYDYDLLEHNYLRPRVRRLLERSGIAHARFSTATALEKLLRKRGLQPVSPSK